MTPYIDAFVLPVPREHLTVYKSVVEQVAKIWQEHGALSYSEFVDDNANMDGTRTFAESANAKENEIVIFGWVTFASRQARDNANEKVMADPRMDTLLLPLSASGVQIFDASRMVYGGFKALIQASD